jgi:thiamine-monophosphate kinase
LGQRLLRVNLSDLAAKGAVPYAALLAVAWPVSWTSQDRTAFATGLGEDLQRYGVVLLGGDTVATPGPFQASLTLLGRVPSGQMVRRGGGVPGQTLLVSGTIGDAWLGLQAARGDGDFPSDDRAWLAARYHQPEPRTDLTDQVRTECAAAADVSDGLLADAGHIAVASGTGCQIDLDRLPLSAPARRWLDHQPDRVEALLALAAGGDDYEIVAAVDVAVAARLTDGRVGLDGPSRLPIWSGVGSLTQSPGLAVHFDGCPVPVTRTGWSHLG